ncbi:hypothetical protein [Planobispora longispora]|uniref:Uncharacterized protein n=1 Tax=Planobispora longispora TaxID=28887 RepID=A0A8J3RWX9_9ACTN|nr:hypothetical protein [Planobispora longispora]GIH81024.1 hypothetical protein Plo01_74530 [Planobispora longispora]
MYPAVPPPSAHVHENAAWARYLLAVNSPRAAQAMRDREMERRRRRPRPRDSDHWKLTDTLARTALELSRPPAENWMPPADEEEEVDARTAALARARTRARMERATRAAEGPRGGGRPRP